MRAPIEAKVVVPAVVNTTVLAFTIAVLGVIDVFITPVSSREAASVMGLVGATLPLVALVAGYLAPHTPRPDPADGDPEPAPVALSRRNRKRVNIVAHEENPA